MTPTDHADRAAYLTNLGLLLDNRHSRTDAIADLEETIRLGRTALTLTPKDHPDQAIHLNNLTLRLGDRYKGIREIANLDEAIMLRREAVKVTLGDHPDRAMYLSNLRCRLELRYKITREITALSKSIEVGRRAIDSTPRDHPDRAIYLNNLGSRLSKKYLREGAPSNLQEAISTHQSALHCLNSSTIAQIVAYGEIIKHCTTISDWQQAYKASKIAIPLIPRLTLRSLENSNRQHRLALVVGLTSDAAAAALHTGKEPSVALAFLEQGRGVLAASLEQMRADILDLEGQQLAEQFVRLRDELDLPAPRNYSLTDGARGPWGFQANRRYEAGKDCLDRSVGTGRKGWAF